MREIQARIALLDKDYEDLKVNVIENTKKTSTFSTEINILSEKVNKSVLDNPGKNKDSEPNIECEMCDSKFLKRSQLKQHMKSEHLKTIVCTLCGQTIQESHQLEEHLIDVHNKKKNFM